MGRPRRPGPLGTLLAAWLLDATGGWVFLVAISVYAFHKGGAGGVSAVVAARLLPAVFAAPVAGTLLDRAPRARVLSASCAIQAACLAGAAALVAGGVALAPLVVLAALARMADTAPRPALQALMPALARSPEELTRATGIWSSVDNGAFLLGGGLGGVAIAAVGTTAIIAAAAVMLALAGALGTRLPALTATAADEEEEAEGFRDAFAGLRALAESKLLRAPYALFAGVLLLEGTSDVQLVSLALGKLSMGNGGPGLLYTVWGVGGMLGGIALLHLVRRRGYGLAVAGGAIVFAVGIALAGVDGVAVALIAMVPAGLGFALVETAVMGLVPRLADDAVIGRVYALSEILYAGAAGIGALIAPLLISWLGAGDSLVVVGVALGLCAVAAWPACARVDAGQERAARVRELLRGVPFLAPLPLPRLERLVRGARSVHVPAGIDIVRQGEPGDDFFVVEEGAVEIVEYGRMRGPGEGFGEIALLRDIPRTATVRASSEVKLWAVSRPAFIGAVSDHAESQRLVDALIEQRLRPPARLAGPG